MKMKEEEILEIIRRKDRSGALSKKKYLEKHYPAVLLFIEQFANKHSLNNMSINQLKWHIRNNTFQIPKCKECKKVLKFKDGTIGYPTFCTTSCTSKNKDSQQKLKISLLKNQGVTHSSLTKKSIVSRYNKKIEIIKKMCSTSHIDFVDLDEKDNVVANCNIHNEEFKLNIGVFHNRYAKNIELCGKCMPFKYSSKPEFEIIEYLNEILPNLVYEHRNRSILNGKEIDIFLPELKFGIEHNGVHWHSDIYVSDDYHKMKADIADEKNVQLVQIWGDDWMYNNDIVKSRLKSILGKNRTIFARKTEIREIKHLEAKQFLNNNHLQGLAVASIRIGLFYNNELVSLMTFGKLRKKLGYTSKLGHYEMYRFCNKLNFNIVGGASKLFKYFIRHYDPLFILSFADRMWSNGDIYHKLDFNFIANTEPDYYYVIDGMRQSRHKWTRQILREKGYTDESKSERDVMKTLGYNRIYGTGSKKYIWTKSV